MTADSESSLSPAQDTGSDSLSADLADALAEHGVTDDTGEPADDVQDTPEPENGGGEAKVSGNDGDGADQTDEADPQAVAADQETAPRPEGDTGEQDIHRQVAEVFHGAVAPYRAHLASKGVSPPQAIQALLAAEYQLSTGTPERKAQILSQLAKDYGVEIDALYEMDNREPVNPEITQLQQRQTVLERQIQGERARVQQEQAQANAQVHQSVEAEVAEFAAEKDSSGNLLRPHLKKVRDEMSRTIGQDPNLNLQDAYDNAVWANPKLRKQALAKHSTAPTSQPAKAAKPRRAAKAPSLRDDLERVYQSATKGART